MDPLSQLPLECLQRIFDILIQGNDIDNSNDSNECNNNNNSSSTLAALLQTNRYIAIVALPYLYKDPFRFSPHDILKIHYTYRIQEPLISRTPIRTLLNSLSPSTILPKVLSLGIQRIIPSSVINTEDSPTANDSTTATSIASEVSSRVLITSQLNYVAQIRHLHQQPWSIGVDQLWEWAQPPPGVGLYIQTQEFEDLCRNAKLIRQDFGEYAVLYPNQTLNQRCYQILFFQEANWALANPILEQLQSLTIPLSDIDRYLEPSVVVRMAKLERVHFLLGRLKPIENEEEWIPHDETEESWGPYARRLHPLVQFVEEHTRLFEGVLREVTMDVSALWKWYGADNGPCPESVKLEINRLLPALCTPISLITNASMLRFLAHPDTTDMSMVTELDTKVLLSNGARESFHGNRDALQRCRALRKLTSASLGEGAFRWAVDEKNKLANCFEVSNGQGALNARTYWEEQAGADVQVPRQPGFWRKSLIPLEEVKILNHCSMQLTDEVDDIAVGFSQTLQSFCAHYYMQSHLQEYEQNSHVGKGWVNLPVLTHLALSVDYYNLIIDRQLLTHCPKAVTVSLTDRTFGYQCEDIEPCLPANLPILETLHLMGWPALTFHPATFHSTTRLKELSVTLSNGHGDDYYDSLRYTWDGNDEISDFNSYIPPIEELHQSYGIRTESSSMTPVLVRPRWSWDWHLPCLESLRLTSEFAFLFNFHMLPNCPALKRLDLNIRTYTNEHTRTISRADLFTTTSHIGDNNDDGSNDEEVPIIAPSLVKLQLHGLWAFANLSTKHQFLSKMFPNLEALSASEWIDFSLSEMIHWARNKVPKPIRSLGLDMVAPSKVDLERLGLVEGDHCCSWGEEDVVMMSVGFVNRQDYVILREGMTL